MLNVQRYPLGHTYFFQGGVGVKFVEPIFNGQFFSNKNIFQNIFQKKLCFFEKKEKNRQYKVKFVFCYSCAL
jgi:hypothetical protein